MEFIDKRDIMKGIGSDTTADLLEKAMGHKYYKREGSPGNYKYYYTEAGYNQAKGKKSDEKENRPTETIEKDGKRYKLQPNGKYLEVSEHGMTKKDFEGEIMYYQKVEENMGNEVSDRRSAQDKQNKYHSIASKLSDKEFTKEELGDKKEELPVKEWVAKYRDSVKSKSDIIRRFCNKQYMSEKDMRLFAVWCAREALKLIDNPDPRSIVDCNVAEKYANGEACIY